MSANNLLLHNDARVATEQRSRSAGGVTYLEEFQRLSSCPIGEMPLPLAVYMEAAGGSIEMAVDGSVTAAKFDVTPGVTDVFRIYSVALIMSLASAPEFTEFGNLAAIASGITIEAQESGGDTIVDLLGGQPLKSNNDLDAVGRLDVRTGAASWSLRCELALHTPVRLDGAAGERLRATVADNLSGLTRLRAFVSGVSEATLT